MVYKTFVISTIVDLEKMTPDILVYKTFVISTIVDNISSFSFKAVYKTFVISTIVDITLYLGQHVQSIRHL